MDLQIVIPMAGSGSRFADVGFTVPKYALPMDRNGTTMMEWAIRTLGGSATACHVIVVQQACVSSVKTITDKMSDLNIDVVTVNALTNGPACSTMEAMSKLRLDAPLLVSNCDQVMSWNLNAFIEKCNDMQLDGAVVTYAPPYPVKLGDIDKHSFVLSDASGYATRFSEKLVISTDALVGIHYYAKAHFFVDAYRDIVEREECAPNGEYYLSLTYNSMVRHGLRVAPISLSSGEVFTPVGIPRDYYSYIQTMNVGVYGEQLALNDTVRGWFVGDFSPSVFKTKDFEVGLMRHAAGHSIPFHVHKSVTEYNLVVSGSIRVNGVLFSSGQFFTLFPGCIACPEVEEDVVVVCVKVPSIPTDKINL